MGVGFGPDDVSRQRVHGGSRLLAPAKPDPYRGRPDRSRPPGQPAADAFRGTTVRYLREPRTSPGHEALFRNKAAARASLERILSWDFDRIILAHGHVVETGGKETLRSAYAFLR